MNYYFAYGSNLHKAQMKKRCPDCIFLKKSILHNFDLAFRSKYGAADIEKKNNCKVYGAIYLISKLDEKKLDVYEEYPTLYKKMYFKKNNHKVMTYIMPKKTKLISPTKRYLNIIKKGYKDWKISSKSLKRALGKLDKIYR
jgi:gamma-glutamylcyclotransferase (GGCT)/AIG2-like uncharacterized protein YtfP